MPSAALNPAVTPFLAYAVIALLVVFSFVIGILVILTKVRRWLKELFVEFSESPAFESAVGRILDRVAEKLTARFDGRIAALEQRDVARARAVTRGHHRTDRLNQRIDRLHDDIIDLYKRLPVQAKDVQP
jgi:hypothetical protein